MQKIIITIVVIGIVGIGSWYALNMNLDQSEIQEALPSQENMLNSPTTENTMPPTDRAPVESSDTTTKPTTGTTPAQDEADVTKVKIFTATEVAQHNSRASCYSIVRGVVYDLTSFIDKHPGGAARILKICGQDGTAEFTGEHGGQEKPEKMLAGFEVGKLQ